MTIAVMLEQSGIMAILGMSIVFGFLIILVAAISILGRLMPAQQTDAELRTLAAGALSAEKGAEIIAAVSAAINEYRKNENRS